MKDIFIEVIFWVGYAVSFSALIFAFISLTYASFKKVMAWKSIYRLVLNNAIDKSIKDASREQMDAWLNRFDTKWKEVHNVN